MLAVLSFTSRVVAGSCCCSLQTIYVSARPSLCRQLFTGRLRPRPVYGQRRTMVLPILFAVVILAVGFLLWCLLRFGGARKNQSTAEEYLLQLIPARKGKLRGF